MIKNELKNVIESVMMAENERELIKILYTRFGLLLLKDISLKDYEKIQDALYLLKDYIEGEV